MFFNSLIIGLSSSIDSLGIGITYGVKKVKISANSNIILFIFSLCITTISMLLGRVLKNFLSNDFATFLGGLLIVSMGLFMTIQALKENKSNQNKENISNNEIINVQEKGSNKEKIFSLFIKCLGVTIQVIKNPNYSDFDNSKQIDAREAIFLGLALSLDSIGIVIGYAISGAYNFFLPFFISLFQIIFLKTGNYIGKKLQDNRIFPDNAWSVISGLLLILIGFFRLFAL